MLIREYLDKIKEFRKACLRTLRSEVVIHVNRTEDVLDFSWKREVKYMGKYSNRCTYQKRKYIYNAMASIPAGLFTVFQWVRDEEVKANKSKYNFKPESALTSHISSDQLMAACLKPIERASTVTKNSSTEESFKVINHLISHPSIEEKHLFRYEVLSKALFGKSVPLEVLVTIADAWGHLTTDERDQAQSVWGSLRTGYPKLCYPFKFRQCIANPTGVAQHYLGSGLEYNKMLLLGGKDFVDFMDKFWVNRPKNDTLLLRDSKYSFDSFSAWMCVLQDKFSVKRVNEVYKYAKSCCMAPKGKEKDLVIADLGINVEWDEFATHFAENFPLHTTIHDLGVLLAKRVYESHKDSDKPLPAIQAKSKRVVPIKTIKEGIKLGKTNGWCISGVRHYWENFIAKKSMLYCVKRPSSYILVQSRVGVYR